MPAMALVCRKWMSWLASGGMPSEVNWLDRADYMSPKGGPMGMIGHVSGLTVHTYFRLTVVSMWSSSTLTID